MAIKVTFHYTVMVMLVMAALLTTAEIRSYTPRPVYSTVQYSTVPLYYDKPPKYSFDYGIRDRYFGTNFGAKEDRDGDLTKGAFYVDLPDGRRQKVTYYVNKDSGFVAEVTYEGKARFPKPTFRPAYESNVYG